MHLFDCTGSLLLHRLFSSCGEQGLPSSFRVLASHCGGCSCWGAPRWGGWYLQRTTWWRDVQMHCERIPLHLVNDHIHHLTYSFLFRVRTFKFYFLSKLLVGNTVLSIVGTMFHIRSSSLSIPVTASLYPFTRLFLFSSPPAATAKSLQSCPTLCDPIDRSRPGSPIPGILQARTLEWVAMSFSNAWKWKVKVKSLSCVRLFSTPWTAAHQAPLSMGLSRQEYWSGVPLPSPPHLLTPDNHFLILCFYGFNIFYRFHM